MKNGRTEEIERLREVNGELLEACRAAIEEFRALGQLLGEYTPPEMITAWNKVEAAIKKAVTP